jgi:heptaprenyl diphosphate synthase
MMRKIALCGMLSAVAIVISSLERFIPLQAIIPLPGLKLGLANCVLILALYWLDLKSTAAILFIKCTVVCLLFSGFSSFAYSFVGGILAVISMWALLKFKNIFSVYGISIAGASIFNFGQITVSAIILGSIYIFSYLPYLLLASVFTGALTGIISNIIIKNVGCRCD